MVAAPGLLFAGNPTPGRVSFDDDEFAAGFIEQQIPVMEDKKGVINDPAATQAQKQEAVKAIQKIVEEVDARVEQAPESNKVLNSAGRLSLQAGDFEKGLLRADKAAEIARGKGDAEGLADALTTRSLGSWYTGDYPRAARDAQQVLEMRPNDPVAKSVYELSKNHAPALGAALKKSPANEGLQQQFNDMLTMAGLLQTPELKLAGARATGRQEALKQIDEGARMLQLGDAQGLLRSAERAQKLDPAIPDVYMQKALALTMLKKLDQVMVELNKAVALWEAFPNKNGDHSGASAARAMRAGLLNDKGRSKDALGDADKALQLNPKNATAFYQKGRALESLKAPKDDILAAYKSAAAHNPGRFNRAYDDAVARLSGAPQEEPAAAAAEGPSGLYKAAGAALAAGLGVLVFAIMRRKKGAAAPPPPPPADMRELAGGKLGPGAKLGQFRIEEWLGRGGQGEVLKALDERLGRHVAIKRLPHDLREQPQAQAQLKEEAKKAASLAHPNICAVYAILDDEHGDSYVPFEYVEGEVLVDRIETKGPLKLDEALQLIKPLCDALDYAHKKNIIHRDIKPSNIIISTDGVPKIFDFGIARMTKNLVTKTDMFMGTPAYSPPEAEYGTVSRSWDFYSLGATLYEALTGKRPFLGPTDRMEGRLTRVQDYKPELPDSLNFFFRRALAPRAEDRFQTGAEFWKGFSSAVNG